MEKLDLRKQLKEYYQPSAKQVSLVNMPDMQFAMIDGEIEPGSTISDSPAFQQAIQALYGVSYTLKFACKLRRDDPVDYPVMPLEGLWWWAEESEAEIHQPDHWTVMIMQPDLITPEMFAEAVAKVRAKGSSPAVDKLRLARFHEGPSVQVMHLGPYSAEEPTIARMLAFAAERGYRLHGRHHEIYLGDPRQARPENLKTVLRHPVVM